MTTMTTMTMTTTMTGDATNGFHGYNDDDVCSRDESGGVVFEVMHTTAADWDSDDNDDSP